MLGLAGTPLASSHSIERASSAVTSLSMETEESKR
jgi:hypothetical protein